MSARPGDAAARGTSQRALLALQRLQQRLERMEAARTEPIAVVGMACRLPGAEDVDAFWRLLRDGVDATTEVPAGRWPIDAYYDPDPDAPGKMYTRRGGFLGAVDGFDAAFFGISPREAAGMDPQQRLLLEVGWEALEAAGQPAAALGGTATGVFVGVSSNDYLHLHARTGDLARIDAYLGTGNSFSVCAGRISHVLGLQGPSLAVDTACSSSLVAAHLACQSLRAQECELALVAGVHLILAPDVHVYFSRLRGLAPDGRSKAFDAAADGYGRGEGCGALVLRRLADARQRGDRVLAVLRGSAVLHDGASSGLTVPNGRSQERVIGAALSRARVAPSEVRYVEAHGTGTPLGDPIEIEALGRVMGRERPRHRPLAVGSVKTNIGHLEAAAGMAGLIKTVLALQHEAIPPHLHLRAVNPRIDLDAIPAEIPRQALAWPRGGERRLAGVSSFGLSGTNAHVVLEEGDAEAAAAPGDGGAQLVALSARSPEALRALAAAHRERARGAADAVADVAFTAAVRRSHHRHRLAVVARSQAELAQRLAAAAEGPPPAPPAAERRVVFVFPGQGSQWPGMGRGLLAAAPPFRAAFEAWDRALQPHLGLSLTAALEAGAADLERIDVVQPLLVAFEASLAALWQAYGIRPDAVVGHSMGEVAAAQVAGALAVDDAARIVAARSRLLRRLAGAGAMLAVELPLEEARARVRGDARLGVAASNGPRATVLSGDPLAIQALQRRLEAEGVFCRRVKVDVAAHGPQVEPLLPELRAALAGLRPRSARVPLWSTVAAARVEGGELAADYWARNLREPVLFGPVLDALAAEGHGVVLEVSPHPILAVAIEDALRAAGRPATVVASLRRDADEREALLAALGALYTAGLSVDWSALHAAGGRSVALPAYPWQRERHWLEAPAAAAAAAPPASADLLGRRLPSPLAEVQYEAVLDPARHAALSDHRVDGRVVVAGATWVAVAARAAADALGEGACAVEEVEFPQALVIAEGRRRTVQTVLTPQAPGRARFRIASLDEAGAWTVHAAGALRAGLAPGGDPPAAAATAEASIDGAALYERMGAAGYQLGPSFRWIEALWAGPGAAGARLLRPEAAGGREPLAPGLVDGCFQVAGAAALWGAADAATADALHVPAGVAAFRVHAAAEARMRCEARVRSRDEGEALADVRVLAEDGRLLLEAVGVRLRRVRRAALLGEGGAAVDAPALLSVAWRAVPEPAPEREPAGAAAPWLIVGDGEGLGAAIASRLEGRGHQALRVDAGAELPAGAFRGVVHLSGLALAPLPAPERLDEGLAAVDAAQDALAALVRSVQELLSRSDAWALWVVTRGARTLDGGEAPSAGAAALWGAVRTLGQEHPAWRCTLVDLDPARPAGEADVLVAELLAAPGETQVAHRGGRRHAARLAPLPAAAPARRGPARPAGDRAFRLEIDRPGVLDALELRAVPRTAPGRGEVEIEVEAAGLNFIDVLKALGTYPGQAPGTPLLGGDVAGTITAVGEGVRGLQVGQAVAGLAPGTFARYVTGPAALVRPRPARLSPAEAAAIPTAFLTAYYAFHEVGRLRPGERVLVHAASGGTGLAAVGLARRLGCRVLATAGTDDKRAFLRGIGIAHVFDSRSAAFAAGVLEATGGEGVDVVLNTLSGEGAEAGLDVLAPDGRFLDISRRDFYEGARRDLSPFRRGLTYAAVDLAGLARRRPELCGALLERILALFAEGALAPPPLEAFPIAAAADAFRRMAQGGHVGKLVLTVDGAASTPVAAAAPGIRRDGTYLVSGGLGGLGLVVAGWLARQGAGAVALVGRRGAAPEAEARLQAIRAAGARVAIFAADVADPEAVRRVLDAVAATLPPLRGVVHAAGLLDDALLADLEPRRIAEVMRPKLRGAWVLHALTAGDRLDHFVLFSSAAALLGSPGQAHYAAANAALDALAAQRAATGAPALSIGWGPWAAVGLAAAREDRAARLAARGVGAIAPAEGASALERLLHAGLSHAAVLRLDMAALAEASPAAAADPLLGELRGAAAAPSAGPLRAAILAAPARQRPRLVEDHVRAAVARVLRADPARVARDAPLRTLGFDSLLALELRNRLEADLELRLSATLAWAYPTVALLAAFLLEQTCGAGAGADAGAPREAAAEDAGRLAVAALSEDEALRQLLERA